MLTNLKEKALSIFQREQETAREQRVAVITADLAAQDRREHDAASLRAIEAESHETRKYVEHEAQEIAAIIAALIPRLEKLEARERDVNVARVEARALAKELGVKSGVRYISACGIVARAIAHRFAAAGKTELALQLDAWLKPSGAQLTDAAEEE